MRSSSVKTTLAVLTLSLTLISAAPSANAREAQTRDTPTIRAGNGPVDRAIRTIRRLIGGVIVVNGDSPSIPIPGGK